jgi:hypothetical protein
MIDCSRTENYLAEKQRMTKKHKPTCFELFRVSALLTATNTDAFAVCSVDCFVIAFSHNQAIPHQQTF